MKRILTGDRPTGPLHLGHFIGSLKQRVALQKDYETFILIADIQALTDNFEDPQKVHDNTLEVLLDNLAVGLDPEKVIFSLQSKIPSTAEIFVYFCNFLSVEKLQHNPTVKQEIMQKKANNKIFKESTPLGFFVYPAHQAADIMTVNASLVPVGEDQLPMIETTRDIVSKFNSLYKVDFFNIPEAKVTNFPRLVGLDGKDKMSKSLNNAIYLKDDSKTLREKVFGMYTDPTRISPSDKGTVEGNPVFIYHEAFNPNTLEVEDLKQRYRQGKVGDVEVKEKLFLALDNLLSPIREKRHYYEQRIDMVKDILTEGSKRSQSEGAQMVEKMKEAMRI